MLFAITAYGIRLWLHQDGGLPAGDRAFSVVLNINLNAKEPGALLRIPPPWETEHARHYAQTLIHPGMRQRRTRADKQKRDIVLVSTRTGDITVKVQYDLHISQLRRPGPKRPALAEEDRASWLTPEAGIPIDSPLVNSILDNVVLDNPETAMLVDRLFDQASERIRITQKGSDDGGVALQRQRGSAIGAHHALVALLRSAHLPARMVSGLNLSATAEKQPVYWIEVYYQDRWHPLDVVGGHQKGLPPDYIPLRKGSEGLLESENAIIKNSYWQIQPTAPPQGLLVSGTPHVLDFLDLTRLTPASREVLALLLLLPLGALGTEFLRQIIGIRTYGTFTPTLLALGIVFVDWLTALITFTLVTLLGVIGRAMLPKLGLSRVPRLSIVFTLVATIMAFVVSLLTHYNPAVDSAVVLLPIVILTMLVDRIYTIADERGPVIALIRLGWTVLAALLSLAILLQSSWGEWLLAYPEAHALTITAIILLGQYKGKRLNSLSGLGWMKEPARKTNRTEPVPAEN